MPSSGFLHRLLLRLSVLFVCWPAGGGQGKLRRRARGRVDSLGVGCNLDLALLVFATLVSALLAPVMLALALLALALLALALLAVASA